MFGAGLNALAAAQRSFKQGFGQCAVNAQVQLQAFAGAECVVLCQVRVDAAAAVQAQAGSGLGDAVHGQGADLLVYVVGCGAFGQQQ